MSLTSFLLRCLEQWSGSRANINNSMSLIHWIILTRLFTAHQLGMGEAHQAVRGVVTLSFLFRMLRNGPEQFYRARNCQKKTEYIVQGVTLPLTAIDKIDWELWLKRMKTLLLNGRDVICSLVPITSSSCLTLLGLFRDTDLTFDGAYSKSSSSVAHMGLLFILYCSPLVDCSLQAWWGWP